MALKGKQKKLDANKDGKISGEDFKLLQDLEKRNPKAIGGIIKKLGITKEEMSSGKPKGVKGLFGNYYSKDNVGSSGTGTEDAMAFLNPLPNYPNQVTIDRQAYALGGFLSKFARKASEQAKEGVVLPKSDSVKQLKELGLSDVRIKEVLDEFEIMSGVEGFDSSIDEFIENVRAEMPKYVNLGRVRTNLQKQGLSDETIDQFFEDVRGRMGTKEANMQASKLMLRIASMEGEPPMGGQDVGMNISREGKAEGGAMDDQMNALAISVAPAKVEAREVEEPMLPDEEMEEDYVDYVVEETLSTEDKTYLNAALEKDAKLSEIFDQVVESATEFTGSGTVEGPGTGRSDSIPARLSDGEFVFTAKATEEIGEDTLMSMMKEAEAAADNRQMAYEGGMIREEKEVMVAPQEPQQQNINVTKTTLDNQVGLLRDEEDLVGKAIRENMMHDPYQRHVRS